MTVKNLVKEYLAVQALKIMPRAPFAEAVVDYVEKDDKHAIQQFIQTSLDDQFKTMVRITGSDERDEGAESIDKLNEQMEELRQLREKEYSEGKGRRRATTKKLKPKPDGWDSDDDGPWEDFPGAFEWVEGPEAVNGNDDDDDAPAPPKKRGRKAATNEDDDEDDAVSVTTTKKAPAKKVPAKRAPAKPKATPTAPKAAAKPRATAATTRGKKAPAQQAFEISDDEDDDDDVVMLDEPAQKKVQPKRAAAIKGGRGGGRQTQLNFSQSQARTQTARELSDDEIDDDDDDAFEPISASNTSRRR